MTPSLAFLACVESGPLEEQALLLCRSLRRFGGRYSGCAVHTFEPRPGRAVAGATRAALEELGAVHHAEPLNLELGEHGTLNKVFACARAEEVLDREILVFVDTDTLFTGEPVDLDLPRGFDAAARPAESAALNSTGPGDPRDEYWQALYGLLGLTGEPRVETELGRSVRAFFSAGLIAVRREAGLFRRWLADLRFLLARGHVPAQTGVRRMDEVALAATLTGVFDRVRVLDGRYNYLIYRRSLLPAPWREAALEDLVHVHYRTCFQHPGYLRTLEPPLAPESEAVRWLEPRLPLGPPPVRPLPV